MAIAYKHQDLGSTVQIIHFVSQRLGELKESIEKWQNENTMWERVDERPGDGVPAEVRGHARFRQRELAEEVSSAKWEYSTLEALRDSLHPCSECEGFGVTSFVDDDYISRTRMCKRCSGSGTCV